MRMVCIKAVETCRKMADLEVILNDIWQSYDSVWPMTLYIHAYTGIVQLVQMCIYQF